MSCNEFKHWFLGLICLVVLMPLACKKNPDIGDGAIDLPRNANGELDYRLSVHTDKAAYQPGEKVVFALSRTLPVTLVVKYRHFGETLEETRLVSSDSWEWTPPSEDYKGYMAELYAEHEGSQYFQTAIAIDVSSDWKKFPRYGFLSKYPEMPVQQQEAILENLNRHHINGLQFYDWQYKHHKPLAGTVASPATSWLNLIGAQCNMHTVQHYISGAHARNMKAMAYNLVFGVVQDAEADGVNPEWYLYTDPHRNGIDNHHLDPPFLSSIYLTNPANTGWQTYLHDQYGELYQVYPFDGFHMDQLGNRNKGLYGYHGESVTLYRTYAPFIESAKAAHPGKYAVFNAVSQYGAKEIAEAPADFLYSEVWDAQTYTDLANTIKENDRLGGHQKNSVIAGYMNYGLSNSPGFFNTPGVLLTEAVIFSHGGAHIELGEHMLCNEYFPNSNLAMRDDLKKAITAYYDFLTAYQNLLRDGGTFFDPNIQATDSKVAVRPWPATRGSIAVMGRQLPKRDVLHFINFVNAGHVEWKDYLGTQTAPLTVPDIPLEMNVTGDVKRVWLASPDISHGISRELEFTRGNGTIQVTLPAITYWNMLVVEYN